MQKKLKKTTYVLMLIMVVLIWGVAPVMSKGLLEYYSPTIKTAITAFIAFVSMLIICAKKLKNLNKSYFIVALPTGLFYSAACILQQIGLDRGASPAMYSFLENLSCLTVPILVWIMTKERPSIFKFIGAILCLISVYILGCGDSFTQLTFGFGETLCALAGLFYGVNMAVTGVKAKNLDAGLYLLVQFGVNMFISFISIFLFEKQPLVTIRTLPILTLVGVTLLSTVLGWLIRTVCLKNLDPTFVCVIMPFSSIVTTLLSIIVGTDKLTLGLVIGAVIGVLAVILSDLNTKTKNPHG